MSQSPKFHKRVGSRASLASVGQMPIISEDANAALPPSPLRVPPKNPRRSLGPPPVPPPRKPLPLPPPYAAAFPSPPPDALLEYQLNEEDEKTVVGQTSPNSSPARGRRRHQVVGYPNSRQRRCRFILVMAIVMVVVVGLVIGLALGLTQKDNSHHNDGGGGGGGNNSTEPGIPTGAFTFETTLQNASTGCTSNPSTWTCFPYKIGSSAQYYWTIQYTNANYYVSSSDNPFAPSFSNLTMTLLDGNQASERLVFSFPMNKTVVPTTAIAPDNRAATCTYIDTHFQATLWTGRVGSGNSTSSKNSHNRRQSGGYSSWAGTVEVTETQHGAPACTDNQGNRITDVHAGTGTCECSYTTSNS